MDKKTPLLNSILTRCLRPFPEDSVERKKDTTIIPVMLISNYFSLQRTNDRYEMNTIFRLHFIIHDTRERERERKRKEPAMYWAGNKRIRIKYINGG